MKKLLLFTLIAAFLLVSLGFASAASTESVVGVGCDPGLTTIGGTIYQNNNLADVISGSNVQVTCYDTNGNFTASTTSDSSGNYHVTFNETSCNFGDDITVLAQKNSLTGQNDGSVNFGPFRIGCLTLNVGIINVPLVPEFGLTMGIMTVLSAVTAFLVIRKR